MNCSKCGTELTEGSAFCTNCGQKMPQQSAAPQHRAAWSVQAKPKKKANVPALIFAALSLLLAAALVVLLVVPGIVSVSGSASIPSKGFDTPEEAIEYFIDCINKGDIEGALAVSATVHIVEKADFEALCERIKAITPQLFLPTEYEFYRKYNQNYFEGRLLRQINGMVLSLTQPEYASVVLTYEMFRLGDEKADYEGMDPALKEPIEIVEIEIPMPDMYYSSTHQKNMRKQMKVYGADDMEYRAVLYKYDGDYYAGGFQLFEYEDKWYICDAQECLMGQPVSGALLPLDNKSDFDNLIE